MKISRERLNAFVEQMQIIAAEERFRKVDMKSIKAPACGTPGCHSGVVMAALDRIGFEPIKSGYAFDEQADRLARFLSGPNADRETLKRFARSNPKWWGNLDGYLMFCDSEAFGLPFGTILTGQQIADHWAAVASRPLPGETTHKPGSEIAREIMGEVANA